MPLSLIKLLNSPFIYIVTRCWFICSAFFQKWSLINKKSEDSLLGFFSFLSLFADYRLALYIAKTSCQ